MISPDTISSALWIAWVVGWWVAARWSAKAVERQPVNDQLTYSIFIWGGAALLFFRAFRRGVLSRALVPHTVWLPWVGVAITAVGLGTTVWARVRLGRLWSAVVTLKAEHTVVRTGPYALTRHPIYSGLLLALAGTTLLRGTVGGLLGFALIAFGIAIKIRQEERLLVRHFGDAYRAYKADVPALVPRPRRGSRPRASA